MTKRRIVTNVVHSLIFTKEEFSKSGLELGDLVTSGGNYYEVLTLYCDINTDVIVALRRRQFKGDF